MKHLLLTLTLVFTALQLRADWQSGLRCGAVSGDKNYIASPVLTSVQPGPHVVTKQDPALVPNNMTWVYQGQIYLNGGPYRFGYAMYTYVYLRINGAVVLNHGYGNTVSAVVELPAGWYDFDLRISHHNTTGLPSGANNWPRDLGFGITTDRNATASGTFFSYPSDPGDMSLFRCTTDALVPATDALLVRGGIGYDGAPNLPAPYLVSPLAPDDIVPLYAPTNHFSASTKKYVRCIGYDLFTNGVLYASGTGTNLTYTHTADLPELVWKWRRDNLRILWDNPAGGDFSNADNWDAGIVPERSDVAVFDIASPAYTVTWSGNATSLTYQVNSGTVTWDLNGHTYYFQNLLTTEYGSLSDLCNFGLSVSPVDMLITNGIVTYNATGVAWSKVTGTGTRVRVHEAQLTMTYVEVGAGATVQAKGANALFNSLGYTAGIYGTIISTNGAFHSTTSGIKLRAGSLCVLSAASGGRTHTTAFTLLDLGSELRLVDGAKVSNTYIGGTPLQRTQLFGTLTMLGSGNHLWDVYNGSGSYIPTLSVETSGLVQGSGKLEFTFVENAGQIWPGGSNSIGALEIKGNMTNRNDGTLVMELASPAQYDQISVTKGKATGIGTLWAGGTLSVTLIDDFEPLFNDTFKILSFVAATNTFDTVNLPGGAHRWDTSKLYTIGEITYKYPNGAVIIIR